ncbi:hypothetical protein KQI84_03150 [bacterium]|nr:hypothetical protein [bacterium]
MSNNLIGGGGINHFVSSTPRSDRPSAVGICMYSTTGCWDAKTFPPRDDKKFFTDLLRNRK